MKRVIWLVYEDTDSDDGDEFVGMADVEAEDRSWREPQGHRRTRKARLCVPRSDCA